MELLLSVLSSVLLLWSEADGYDLLPGFQQRFIQMGVLCEEETARYFRATDRLDEDLWQMKWRLDQLRPDTPTFDDIQRLPPAKVTRENWVLACRYLRYLQDYCDSPWTNPAHVELVQPILNYQRWTVEFWCYADDAHVRTRREGVRWFLGKVKETVGTEKWERCEWPSPLPEAAYNSPWEGQ